MATGSLHQHVAGEFRTIVSINYLFLFQFCSRTPFGASQINLFGQQIRQHRQQLIECWYCVHHDRRHELATVDKIQNHRSYWISLHRFEAKKTKYNNLALSILRGRIQCKQTIAYVAHTQYSGLLCYCTGWDYILLLFRILFLFYFSMNIRKAHALWLRRTTMYFYIENKMPYIT